MTKTSLWKLDWDFIKQDIIKINRSFHRTKEGLRFHKVRSHEAGLKLDIIIRTREGFGVTPIIVVLGLSLLWEWTRVGAIQENYKTKICFLLWLFYWKQISTETFLKLKKNTLWRAFENRFIFHFLMYFIFTHSFRFTFETPIQTGWYVMLKRYIYKRMHTVFRGWG